QSTVHLKIDSDGGITVHSLAAEIGQGSDTMLAQCVAEPLGVSLDRIRIFSSDSDTAPIDLGSYSSRVTFMAGNAARRAAEQVRTDLISAASRLTGYQPEGFVLKDERVIYAPDPSVGVSFMDALQEAIQGKGALVARGCYASAPPMGGKFKGAAAGLSPSYTFQAYVARVSVDPESGFVTVRRIWAAHDCGRALNPLAVVGQIQGCVHMGLGQALAEDFRLNRGSVLDANLLDYRTLTPKQMPPVEVFVIETDDPEGPFGAKEAGEGPILPVAPAIANAIHDAVGIRLKELPMTPDRILAAIQAGPRPVAPGANRRPAGRRRDASPARLARTRS
ncbi:MAG TPA: molybdopterin cofactor-binding domain-containing protein, partial [Candidatus Polarisedimenticolia bacterium]|nr:molybdopterin cofactor-binding domain-containing protein [Candidatus Polarisedimenticolia bacterium]